MIHPARMTARINGEFAVFLIGMRLNRPLAVHRWLPTMRAMPAMLRELYERPELGLLSHELWFSRTTLLVQYWRSVGQLLDYARAREAAHLPAWQRFNRRIGTDGSVGIWHETYVVAPGRFENVYVNMPAFGLGKAGTLVEARAGLQSAAARLAGGKLAEGEIQAEA
ncbi:MAG: DUF4188 domain-containing protein [Sphingomonadales bacterium]|nr:DUF4188 domain-containing protein [Sphingomonadales bacterium]